MDFTYVLWVHKITFHNVLTELVEVCVKACFRCITRTRTQFLWTAHNIDELLVRVQHQLEHQRIVHQIRAGRSEINIKRLVVLTTNQINKSLALFFE